MDTASREGLMMAYSRVKTFALVAAAMSSAAAAQGLSPGSAIVDTKGQAVGTVVAVTGDTATVRTDRHEVRLPLASIRVEKNGGVVATTQAELNAGVEQAMQQLSAALTPGAAVYDPAGGVAGSIGAVEGELITLKLPSTREVRLPRTSFSMGRRGLLVGTTAAQIEAQLPQGS